VVMWQRSTFGAKVTGTVEKVDGLRRKERGKRTESPE
jgi:hypothetical protein